MEKKKNKKKNARPELAEGTGLELGGALGTRSCLALPCGGVGGVQDGPRGTCPCDGARGLSLVVKSGSIRDMLFFLSDCTQAARVPEKLSGSL